MVAAQCLFIFWTSLTSLSLLLMYLVIFVGLEGEMFLSET